MFRLFANYVLVSLSFLLLLVVKSLKFYLYCFFEAAWFFGLRTNLLYRYCFLVSLDIAFTWCVISYYAITFHLPDITVLSCNHLTSDRIYLTHIIIMITKMMPWHLVYILIYFSTNSTPNAPVLLILLTCSYSFPKSDNYLINYKKEKLTSG